MIINRIVGIQTPYFQLLLNCSIPAVFHLLFPAACVSMLWTICVSSWCSPGHDSLNHFCKDVLLIIGPPTMVGPCPWVWRKHTLYLLINPSPCQSVSATIFGGVDCVCVSVFCFFCFWVGFVLFELSERHFLCFCLSSMCLPSVLLSFPIVPTCSPSPVPCCLSPSYKLRSSFCFSLESNLWDLWA